MIDRPSLPPSPEPAEPPPFPVLAAFAPVGLAAVMFAVTRTPVVLLFGLFGPVLAVGSVVDGRLQTRRRLRRARAVRETRLDELEQHVGAVLADRVGERARIHPSSAVLAAAPERWRSRPPVDTVVLGTADLPTEPALGGSPAGPRDRELLARAALLPTAPLTVDARVGLAVAGPPLVAAAAARAIAVQRARAGLGLTRPPVVITADDSDAELVLEVSADLTGRIAHASGTSAHLAGTALAPGLLSADTLATVAQQLRDGAAAPDLGAVLAQPAAAEALRARFLCSDGDPIDVDLVEHGPHAIVAGTTGSGKSALLTAWVLALAAAHPPAELQLLLVDCKGGAAFDPLATLPHVAGLVTDLDAAGAERAVRSLGAELRRRERVLREAGVPTVVGSGLPRLVVVVDEYRALVEAQPDLAVVLADLAARGRSLGVHLVLATQRPAGAVRADMLANCGLRISLRVHDAADSRAVIGTDAAARIDRADTGSAILVTSGDRAAPVRVVRTDPAAVIEAVAGITAASMPEVLPRPWLDPLPSLVRKQDLPAAGAGRIALGLLDLPDEQRQPLLAWDPAAEPRLLIIGDPRSGRSTALETVAAGLDAAVTGDDPASAWERTAQHDRPLLVDDLEHLLDRLGPAHGPAAVERLVLRLRDRRAAPTVLVLRGPSGWSGAPVRPLVGLADRILQLRLGLDDHLALGGARSTWTPGLPPGGASWAGERAQLAVPSVRAVARDRSVPPELDLTTGRWLLATAAPVARRARLADAGVTAVSHEQLAALEAGVAVVGMTTWQTEWSALTRLAGCSGLLTDGLAPADHRTVTGTGALPPPVSHPDDVVFVPSEGQPERRRLPRAVRPRP